MIVAAADTYRAAAVEQLETWAERAGCEIVKSRDRAATRARWSSTRSRPPRRGGRDVVIIDTAGRLHTHGNLMDELAKVRRVIDKRLGRAPRTRP